MKERIPEHLSEILTELEQQLSARASAAYLYGSMTRRYSDTSDIDLLLVTDSDPGPVYVTLARLQQVCPRLLHPLLATTNDMAVNPLLRELARTGIRLR
jgi:predicted nucleotidyltransferase